MRLKSFYAKTMTEAMQMVRDTLGDDAVIVATREENGGRSVRVTAAIESFDDLGFSEDRRKSAESSTDKAQDEYENFGDNWLQYDDESDQENNVIELLTEVLLGHAAPPDVMENLISTIMMSGIYEPENALSTAMDHLYSFIPLSRKPSRKPVVFVGPPGAGKTLATAKLAARAVMDGLNVSVITTDTVRAGGVEQLQAFTKLMDVELIKVKKPEELKRAIQTGKEKDFTIVDTGGTNPFDLDEMHELAGLIEDLPCDPVLVMPAGMDPEDSAEIARSFAILGVQKMLPTRLDLVKRMGGLLSAAQKGGLSFTDYSDTPKVANGLTALTPQRLARLLIGDQRLKAISQKSDKQARKAS